MITRKASRIVKVTLQVLIWRITFVGTGLAPVRERVGGVLRYIRYACATFSRTGAVGTVPCACPVPMEAT
jgi:hypothetical protein